MMQLSVFVVVWMCVHCNANIFLESGSRRDSVINMTARFQDDYLLQQHSLKQTEIRSKPTILIGMMVTDQEPLRKIEAHRRSLRNFTEKGISQCDIKLFFFYGRSSTNTSVYGSDVVHGDFPENLNNGKTRQWIIWAVDWFKHNRKNADNRSVVIKMDSDATVRWGVLDSLIPTFDHQTYFGRPLRTGLCNVEEWLPCLFRTLPKARCVCPDCRFPRGFDGNCWFYMAGAFYGVSHGVAERLRECWVRNYVGIEDALFGATVKRCGIAVRPRRIDGAVFRPSTLHKALTVEEVDVWASEPDPPPPPRRRKRRRPPAVGASG